jgi:basic membrane lipoprotein Med (substrate-binding protein (PBP1-ABC) superfamily)
MHSSVRHKSATNSGARSCIHLLAIAITGVSVIGCGRSTPSDSGSASTSTQAAGQSGTAAPSASDFKVALVMSGPTTDNGWNAGALKALKDVQKELNLTDAQISYKENAKSPSDQNENLQAFASQGYTVVIGHGEEYQDIALKMESQFPKTHFVISSGSKLGKNTTPIVFKLEDGAYLLGMLAGGMTHTGKIGAVGAQKIPPVQSVFSAFALGAKAARPDVTFLPPVYTNDWDDVGKAKQATLPLIGQGADVIIQDLDNAAQGVFNAVQESSRSGKTVYALGTNNDQNAAAPDVILASAPIFLSPVFTEIVKEVRDGAFKPSKEPYGLQKKVIGFVINPQLASKIPPALKKKLDDAEKQIESGTLNVPMAN